MSDAKLAARDADVTDLAELLLDQAQILDGEVPERSGSLRQAA